MWVQRPQAYAHSCMFMFTFIINTKCIMYGTLLKPRVISFRQMTRATIFPRKISPNSAAHFSKFCGIPQRCNQK